jgi:hypothetical protein
MHCGMAHMYMHSSNDGSSHVGVDALRSEIRLRSDDATSSSDGRAHPIGIAAATSAEPPHPFVRLPRREAQKLTRVDRLPYMSLPSM